MVTFTEWLFQDLLRIPAYMISGNLFQDILYLIFLPSLVLLFFLHYVAASFVPDKKKNWRILVSVAFYLLIIQLGWYGPFATFAVNYMIIFLVIAGLAFFVTRFIRYKGGEEIGGAIGKVVARTRRIKDLEEEKRFYQTKLQEARAMYQQALASNVPQAAQEWARAIRNYEEKLREIESELKRLKRVI